MLKSTKGSNTGQTVQTFEKGETYTISDKLAEVFVDHLKVAEYASRRTEETKMEAGSRENKDAADEKKSNKDEKKEGRRS
jgi:hypothetical protein